jgi:5-bromo-4-chloroindolyl phosphate hydrolysis protein
MFCKKKKKKKKKNRNTRLANLFGMCKPNKRLTTQEIAFFMTNLCETKHNLKTFKDLASHAGWAL